MDHQNILNSKSQKKHSAFFTLEKKEHGCLGDGDNHNFFTIHFFRFEKFNPLEINLCNCVQSTRSHFHFFKMMFASIFMWWKWRDIKRQYGRIRYMQNILCFIIYYQAEPPKNRTSETVFYMIKHNKNILWFVDCYNFILCFILCFFEDSLSNGLLFMYLIL